MNVSDRCIRSWILAAITFTNLLFFAVTARRILWSRVVHAHEGLLKISQWFIRARSLIFFISFTVREWAFCILLLIRSGNVCLAYWFVMIIISLNTHCDTTFLKPELGWKKTSWYHLFLYTGYFLILFFKLNKPFKQLNFKTKRI